MPSALESLSRKPIDWSNLPECCPSKIKNRFKKHFEAVDRFGQAILNNKENGTPYTKDQVMKVLNSIKEISLIDEKIEKFAQILEKSGLFKPSETRIFLEQQTTHSVSLKDACKFSCKKTALKLICEGQSIPENLSEREASTLFRWICQNAHNNYPIYNSALRDLIMKDVAVCFDSVEKTPFTSYIEKGGNMSILMSGFDYLQRAILRARFFKYLGIDADALVDAIQEDMIIALSLPLFQAKCLAARTEDGGLNFFDEIKLAALAHYLVGQWRHLSADQLASDQKYRLLVKALPDFTFSQREDFLKALRSIKDVKAKAVVAHLEQTYCSAHAMKKRLSLMNQKVQKILQREKLGSHRTLNLKSISNEDLPLSIRRNALLHFSTTCKKPDKARQMLELFELQNKEKNNLLKEILFLSREARELQLWLPDAIESSILKQLSALQQSLLNQKELQEIDSQKIKLQRLLHDDEDNNELTSVEFAFHQKILSPTIFRAMEQILPQYFETTFEDLCGEDDLDWDELSTFFAKGFQDQTLFEEYQMQLKKSFSEQNNTLLQQKAYPMMCQHLKSSLEHLNIHSFGSLIAFINQPIEKTNPATKPSPSKAIVLKT